MRNVTLVAERIELSMDSRGRLLLTDGIVLHFSGIKPEPVGLLNR